MKREKTNAMRILEKNGIEYIEHAYEHKKNDPVDGVAVAEKISEPVERVFKTLVTQANTKEYFVFMIPVDKELDLKKCAKAAGVKHVEMLPLKDLTKTTGYIRGGCSPLGMKKEWKTFAQEEAVLYDTIFFSGGKIGLQIEANANDLEKVLDIAFHDLIRS